MAKISTCCMKNMESVISSHKQVLNPSKEYFRCNCRARDKCLLDSKYLTPSIAYEAKGSNETNN